MMMMMTLEQNSFSLDYFIFVYTKPRLARVFDRFGRILGLTNSNDL